MHRVFSPDDESIRWDDLSRLPQVGEHFFDLAETIAGQPVSHQLDTVVLQKDGLGAFVEVPLTSAIQVDPEKILLKLAKLKHFRANRLPRSRANVITASRISGAAAEEIYRVQTITEPLEAEKLRGTYQLIHHKIGASYMEALDEDYSEKNRRIFDIYRSLGKIITGYSHYFYEPKNPNP